LVTAVRAEAALEADVAVARGTRDHAGSDARPRRELLRARAHEHAGQHHADAHAGTERDAARAGAVPRRAVEGLRGLELEIRVHVADRGHAGALVERALHVLGRRDP